MSRKETGKPIPGDWDGENYSFYMLCGPDSVLWDGYIRGAIFELTRGRQWDGNTGNIKATQEIAWEIYESMAKCNDFINVQRMLVAAITGQAVNLDDPLPTGVVDFTGVGLAAQLRTVDADKRMADVVEDLQLSPVTNVTNQVDPAAVTVENNVTCKCGGCGGCEGTDPPPPPATEGDPPPEGWQPPIDPDTGQETTPGEPAYQNRKCKVSNMLHDGIRKAIYDMNIAGVEDYWLAFWSVVGGSLGAVLGPIVAAIIAASLGPFALVGGILGVVSGTVAALALGSPNLSNFVTLLDDNQSDLVCALYNSTNADQAISDYIQVLSDAGANSTQQAVLWAMFNTVAANALFFRLDDADGDAVEAALADYTGPVDCGVCGGCDVIFNSSNSFTGWTSADQSDAGCSTSAVIGTTLETTLNVASAPYVAAVRLYTAPLATIQANGWMPAVGSKIRVHCDAPSDGFGVGVAILVEYQTDPQQGVTGTLTTSGIVSLTLNSSDVVSSVKIDVRRATSGSAIGSIGATIDITEICFS